MRERCEPRADGQSEPALAAEPPTEAAETGDAAGGAAGSGADCVFWAGCAFCAGCGAPPVPPSGASGAEAAESSPGVSAECGLGPFVEFGVAAEAASPGVGAESCSTPESIPAAVRSSLPLVIAPAAIACPDVVRRSIAPAAATAPPASAATPSAPVAPYAIHLLLIPTSLRAPAKAPTSRG